MAPDRAADACSEEMSNRMALISLFHDRDSGKRLSTTGWGSGGGPSRARVGSWIGVGPISYHRDPQVQMVSTILGGTRD